MRSQYTDSSRQVQQTLVVVSDQFAEYSNFFMYGHGTRRMLEEGWYIKHIHDDQVKRIAWVLYERVQHDIEQLCEENISKEFER